MKKTTFGIASSSLSGLLLAVLFACNVPNNQPMNSNNTSINQSATVSPYSLTGKVNFEKAAFSTKASFADLISGASVTLLNASTGSALGASVNTDASGNFTFTPMAGFTPVTGMIYVVEASKRVGANPSGSPILAVRTYVQWNGTSYTSITGSSIFVNTYTTALAFIANKGDVTPASTIGKITVAGGVSTPVAIVPVTGAGANMGADVTKITNVTKLVQQAIYFQLDPFGSINYNAGNYALGLSATSTLSNGGLGTQIDRLALPSLNIVINGYNGFTKAAYDSLGMTKQMRDDAKDLSNSRSPADDITNYRSFWTTAIGAVFPDSTKTGSGQFTAAQLATAFTPDVQTLDMTKITSFGSFLNGRLLSDDVVDVELQVLSGLDGKSFRGENDASTTRAKATDGVNANDRAFTNTFPYLAGPQL